MPCLPLIWELELLPEYGFFLPQQPAAFAPLLFQVVGLLVALPLIFADLQLRLADLFFHLWVYLFLVRQEFLLAVESFISISSSDPVPPS